MNLLHNYSLKQYNTFGFDVSADCFAAPETVEELTELLSDSGTRSLPKLVIGGGSNMLFTGPFRGLVIQPRIKGIEKVTEDSEYVYLKAGAGVVWDDFVAYSVAHQWGGAENLSHIPGHVGASPIQNIGAYGVEVKDLIHRVDAIVMDTGDSTSFTNSECAFGYRDSIFKHAWKNRVIITHVTYRLCKHPQLCVSYGNVEEELKHYPAVTLETVRAAIVAIRKRKLPDPADTGNAGSFFKNPVVSEQQAAAMVAQDPQMTVYRTDDGLVKLPAARLIERSGWKGKRTGNVGVHTQQALVLVNYGKGRGEEILALAAAIQQSVCEQFGIRLEMEVNVV